jgi:SAM-dependent methyltransferase
MQIGIDCFQRRTACPNCESKDNKFFAKVFSPLVNSAFGLVELSPEVRRNRILLRCRRCGLLFHYIIPQKKLLLTLNEGDNLLKKWVFNNSRSVLYKRTVVEKIANGKSLLDVGCFTGDFLSHFGETHELWGIEPSLTASNFAKKRTGNKIINNFLEDAELPRNYFSVVTMFDVLEHLYDVKAGLLKIYNSLESGGILIIETGNYSSLFARLLRGNWWYFTLLDHLTFWNDHSLITSLRHYGFELVSFHRGFHEHERVLKIFGSYMLTPLFYSIMKLDIENFYLKQCRRFGRTGTPPAIYYPDHIFLVARKVI